MSTTGFPVESIYDYFALPTLVTSLDNISALWNRACDLVWNDWFRDENLQNSLTVSTGDGPDDPATYELRKRNKRKDYFTSGLPWPQKGDAVSLPLVGSAPVVGNSNPIKFASGPANTTFPLNNYVDGTVGAGTYAAVTGMGVGQVYANLTTDSGLIANLNNLSAFTINAIRQAALYQQILELDARGGTRYVESIYTRFGVISPDFRLQRPELIGQGSTRINIYAVPQTAPTATGVTPQGNLAAFGTSIIQGDHGCRYAATEHGMIIGFANVRADLTYQQGVPKMFTRQTRREFYEPLLNGLGEQSVLLGELYAQGTVADQNVFCYQERWAEMRFKNSEITGKFRSTDPQSLDVWHLSQEFGSAPALNSSFITEAVPMARVLAVTTEPSFLSDISYSYTHVRPMPIRSNPGIKIL